MAIGAEGKIALTGTWDGTARIWDLATGKPIPLPLRHQGRVLAAALSVDGNVALTGSMDKTARLWETATGKPIASPLQHTFPVVGVALSQRQDRRYGGQWQHHAVLGCSDRRPRWTSSLRTLPRRLKRRWQDPLSTNLDATGRLWDTATGKNIAPPLQLRGTASSLAISANGKIALAASDDNLAWLWETATGKPIGSVLFDPGLISQVALSADGTIALTGGTAQLWKIPRLANAPDRIALWAQVITGMEADEQGNPASSAPPPGTSAASNWKNLAARRLATEDRSIRRPWGVLNMKKLPSQPEVTPDQAEDAATLPPKAKPPTESATLPPSPEQQLRTISHVNAASLPTEPVKLGTVHFAVRLDVAGQYADNLLHFLHTLQGRLGNATFTISCGDTQRNKNYRAALFGSQKSDPVEARAAARYVLNERPAPVKMLSTELRTPASQPPTISIPSQASAKSPPPSSPPSSATSTASKPPSQLVAYFGAGAAKTQCLSHPLPAQPWPHLQREPR